MGPLATGPYGHMAMAMAETVAYNEKGALFSEKKALREWRSVTHGL